MKTSQDRVFNEGIYWLANNTENDTAETDAVRLLAYLTDTTETWIWQAVGKLQEAMAANDRKTQDEEPPRDVNYDCDPIADQRMDASDFGH